MKSLQTCFLLLFSTLIFISCDDDDPILIDPAPLVCEETNSPFQALFEALIASGHTDEVTMDTEIHAYTFTLAADREICKIGYQSQPGVQATPYVMEIVDNSTATTIYSDSHVFSSSETSYVLPSKAVILQSGVSYTVKRIQTDWGTNLANLIGRMAWKDTMSFPYTNGIMTITGSDFYQNGGPLKDWGLPYIDFIFK